jgi:hypothetical protein
MNETPLWKIGDFQALPEITDKSYENETIVLDGKVHRNCRFTHCKLVYKGGGAKLESCSGSEGCSFEFQDQAALMLQMLSELGWSLVPPAWMGASQTPTS